MALFFIKSISSALIKDQTALHASEAARSILEEPVIRLDPEVAKHRHKLSTKPVVFACSKIRLAVSFSFSWPEILGDDLST